uniref:Uncharacterized protein n=1 Tax=Rhizophora mucronata TaxID=61149 RepID=A0A2P2NNV4_RHIMU
MNPNTCNHDKIMKQEGDAVTSHTEQNYKAKNKPRQFVLMPSSDVCKIYMT